MRMRNIAAFVLVIIAIGIVVVSGQNRVYNQRMNTTTNTTTSLPESKIKNSPTDNLEKLSAPLSEVKTETITPGDESSPAVKTGDTITVNYRGWLASNGTVFDQSFNHFGDSGFTFVVGQGVIQGWSQGVVGMKVGEVRRLKIPASLGYGSEAQGEAIPANSDLIFDVELLKIK